MAEFKSDHAVCDRVIIDDDISIIGTVTAVTFRNLTTSYEVSYIYNGASYAPSIEAWRVTKAPAHGGRNR